MQNLSILIKMDVHDSFAYSEIIWSIILFRCKWVQGDPYLEAVNLEFIFTWGDEETEDRAKVSTSPLFEGSSINNSEIWDNLSRTKCMAMLTWLKIKTAKIRVKRCVWHEIIKGLSPFEKENFKVTLIERQSL